MRDRIPHVVAKFFNDEGNRQLWLRLTVMWPVIFIIDSRCAAYLWGAEWEFELQVGMALFRFSIDGDCG